MSSPIAPTLDLLHGVADRRAGARRALCGLLGQPEGSPLTRLLVEGSRRLGSTRLDGLLGPIVKSVADRRFVRNVNDWPLAHFWVDPRERQHSKLLGWFLDPTAEHGCGTFLLGSLLGFLQERGILPDDRLFPPAGCRVIA